jgi:hypothetical protein
MDESIEQCAWQLADIDPGRQATAVYLPKGCLRKVLAPEDPPLYDGALIQGERT